MPRGKRAPLVGVIMGSDSDWEIMQHAVAQLDAFGVPYEARVLSAHRTPDDSFAYAEGAVARPLGGSENQGNPGARDWDSAAISLVGGRI